MKQLQAELDARRRSAEEGAVRKSRFLAQVSHDIRNPVNAISLLAELLYRTASEPAMAGEVPSIAADLRRNAVSLVELVSDVLDLTRYDAGRVELEHVTFSLHEMLGDECRRYSELAAEKGIAVHCQLPPAPLQIRTDRVKLSRVLGNLLGNALKYTQQQGTIIVSAGHGGPDKHSGDGGGGGDGGGLNNGGGVVWLRVSDTGAGIPPEFHQRIFDEFFQLRQEGGQQGVGLGLSICKRLVEAMGGSIHLQSEVGRGSTFTVVLPPQVVVQR
jgi:signal transduction histidine kinase